MARARRRISVEAAAAPDSDEAAAKRHAKMQRVKHSDSPPPAGHAANRGLPGDAAAADLHDTKDDVQHYGTVDNMEGDEGPMHSLDGAGAGDGSEAGPSNGHEDGQQWAPGVLAPAETLEEIGDDAGLQAAKAGGFGMNVRLEVAQRLAEQLPGGVPPRSGEPLPRSGLLHCPKRNCPKRMPYGNTTFARPAENTLLSNFLSRWVPN